MNCKQALSKIKIKKSEHSGTAIAFIDGNRYIQAVQSDIKPTVFDANPSEHPITQEIIAELKEYITGNQFDNESLLRQQDKLQTEISKHLKNPKKYHFSTHSRHFNKQKLIERLQQFEQIKQKANAHRFKSSFEKFNIERMEMSADEIMASIQSFDDLMSCVYVGNNAVPGFSNLFPVQEKASELIDTSYKYKIAYSKFSLTQEKLLRLIDSAKSMNDIFWALQQEGAAPAHFRYDLYNLMREKCPTFIQNISDLIDVLEYLPDSTQCDMICEKIKHRLPEILAKKKGTADEYCAALSLLAVENKSLLIQTMLSQQPMHLEALSSLCSLSKHLDEAQFALILSSVVAQIPDAMVNDSVDNIRFVIEKLNDNDWSEISTRVAEQLSFKTVVLLCKDLSINKQRLIALISHWIATTSIESQYHDIIDHMQFIPHECKSLFFDKIKICLLKELEELEGSACESAAASLLFQPLLDYYSEDKEIIDKLSDYLIKNNFKHIEKSNAKQIVELLMEGLIHKDAAKIDSASALYNQQKSWLPLFTSKRPFDRCLVPGMSRKMDKILNLSP